MSNKNSPAALSAEGPRRRSRPARLAAGFTLVEIMVGMIIGMLGIAVMMQIFLLSEGSRRSSTGGADAQINGAGALDTLTRDVGHSGYGLTSLDLVGCNLTLRSGVVLNTVAPVTINHASIPAGDANSDTLLLAFANSAGSPEGDVIILQPATNTYSVAAPTSFAVGDWIIAQARVRPASCNLTMERVITRTSSPPDLTVTTGVAGITNGTLFNIGASPRFLAYAIRRGNLTVCDYQVANCGDSSLTTSETVWAPIASNIVSMRAQYGRDSSALPMDGIVDAYNRITPGSAADVSGFTLKCAISRVLALRLALVARNGGYEKAIVTSAAPSWTGAAGAPIVLDQLPDGTANADWQHFRYRVFENVIPIRNMVGLGAQTGC